ncbi:MAG TPA: hypothetical protein VHQ22_12580 [Terriglobales bacterium]|jgi:hypothetical protein|nr:hypothetical protein [Terriglobales bacterium]
MSIRKVFSTIFAVAVLSALVTLANAQTTDETARDLALSAVRSQLHLRPDQFVGIHRDEELQQFLAVATVGWQAGSEFIYRVSQTGVEIKQNVVVNHVATDADFMYIVAVSSMNGNTFRIHGFADSLAEFNKLMTTAKEKVASPEQAESLAEFYRAVNPQNMPLAPISSLIELKQAAERQCHSGVKSFDTGEDLFTAWWKRVKPLYAALPFEQRAIPHGHDYRVEWIVLSSASGENCGGAPLRARLEVRSDGHVSRLTFSPLRSEPVGPEGSSAR